MKYVQFYVYIFYSDFRENLLTYLTIFVIILEKLKKTRDYMKVIIRTELNTRDVVLTIVLLLHVNVVFTSCCIDVIIQTLFLCDVTCQLETLNETFCELFI